MVLRRRSIRKLAAATALVAAVAACGTSNQTEAPVSLTPLPPETAQPASANRNPRYMGFRVKR